jgi:hypothetical protein
VENTGAGQTPGEEFILLEANKAEAKSFVFDIANGRPT